MYKMSSKRFFGKIGREFGLQPELFKGEFEHSVKIKFIIANLLLLRHIWESYLKSDVLCLALINAMHSMKPQKLSGFGFQECLTEVS